MDINGKLLRQCKGMFETSQNDVFSKQKEESNDLETVKLLKNNSKMLI